MKRSILITLLLIGCASPRHVQLSDPSFDAVVAAPARLRGQTSPPRSE
ncbi:MAG TPA: hypothetical protein VKB93_19515 [Thermoanaerobaculia bacterium]|nr:hypothetical protein [Thermoanaerobaculia bacterium]